MTELQWDQVGERRYTTGVDRGVLYPPVGSAVVWNGLTSVDENATHDTTSFYVDGVKYLERMLPGDFSGSLKAYTYPEAFDELVGLRSMVAGMRLSEQPPQAFNLSYRTRVGNDTEGADHGYKIHIIYNVLASPDAVSHVSIGNEITASEFSWALTATPKRIAGFRPTAHVVFDSTELNAGTLAYLEALLYGTDTEAPSLPSLAELRTLALFSGHINVISNGDGTWNVLEGDIPTEQITIFDGGNGTWKAWGPTDKITMLDSTTFQISNVNAVFIDSTTYEVSTTEP